MPFEKIYRNIQPRDKRPPIKYRRRDFKKSVIIMVGFMDDLVTPKDKEFEVLSQFTTKHYFNPTLKKRIKRAIVRTVKNFNEPVFSGKGI